MSDTARLRADLRAVMAAADPAMSAADRLCVACVELFDVDGAAISLVQRGATVGTVGSSGALSRRLEELVFTLGEGPCLDAVAGGRPVLVPDLDDVDEHRWPAFAVAGLDAGVHAVFAFPTTVAATHLGALDLVRSRPGPLSSDGLAGGPVAAQLAALPLLDVMTADVARAAAGDDDDDGDGRWPALASLDRLEVYQATGMVMVQLDVGPAEAVARLRAHAFATGRTASEVSWAVVERRLSMASDDGGGHGDVRSS